MNQLIYDVTILFLEPNKTYITCYTNISALKLLKHSKYTLALLIPHCCKIYCTKKRYSKKKKFIYHVGFALNIVVVHFFFRFPCLLMVLSFHHRFLFHIHMVVVCGKHLVWSCRDANKEVAFASYWACFILWDVKTTYQPIPRKQT